jgi:carbonic anhydrase
MSLLSYPYSFFFKKKKRKKERPGVDRKISLKQSVLDDLKILHESPYIRKELAEKSTGYVYDLKTGELELV